MSYSITNFSIVAFWQNSQLLTAGMFLLLAGSGSLIRWRLQCSSRWEKTSGTLIANIIASFFLGLLLGGSPSGATITVVGTGFLGSISTFSTVMMEVESDLERKRKMPALIYLSVSILGGTVAALVGLEIGAR